jgi:hypothetical protein
MLEVSLQCVLGSGDTWELSTYLAGFRMVPLIRALGAVGGPRTAARNSVLHIYQRFVLQAC